VIRVIRVGKSINGQYYFSVVASNGNILATSETYWNKTDCLNAAGIIQGGGGTIQDAS
jgi:uncharacterized protein YegP (UPF0339 family)